MRETSDEVVEVTVVEKPADDVVVVGGGGTSPRRRKDGDGLVKWERFLPKISLRVLLVEADDSTREIISTLLKKCSYRVASVPDGLKAWEMLKANSQSVDLILTEVDLPSISGYALLTLIMEHDICKNIPVIMMSTHDSVNTVYKCMLKGAADYLVKPLRMNELRNLWQHVWRRRQSALAPGDFPLDESVEHQKLEGVSANNSTSKQENVFERDECPVIETSAAKSESRIELDLSLRRPNQSSGDSPSLQPSSGSAFTRYVHRPLQTQCSVSQSVPNQRKNVAASEDGNIVLTNQYNSSEPPPSADSPGPPFSNQINSWPGQGSYPTQVPIKSIHFTGPNTAYVAPASLSPSQQSLREVALNKFRMKRKDRCFGKKVRYESRKKLAEQRPRIKGQFVRQVQSIETTTQQAPQ